MFNIKSTWYGIKSWFRYTFNKYHIKLIKEAFTGRPWDEGYLLELEHKKIEEMADYHQRIQRFEGVEYVIRDMKICLSLMDIFMGKKDLFRYDGHLTFVDADEKYGTDEKGNPYKEIKTTPDFKYVCLVNVNTKNIDRFVKNEHNKSWYLEHPHELYELKARYLYHKIRFEREEEWWD